MTTSANDNDPRVTQVYRDLATEKTPPALDDRVIAMAAASARTRYGRARAWVRPVAWAAMIGLSFAFVLEMTRFADEPPPQADLDAGRILDEPGAPSPAGIESDSVADEFKTEGLGKLQEAEEQALMRAGEKREAVVPASTAAFAVKRQAARACDDAQRAVPETWYDCAESLREMGHIDAADRELEALRDAFPDFVVPGPE